MSGPAIEIESLRLSLGGRLILDDVSCRIPAGSTFGLVGPNGAGKTTFVGCLVGLLRADSGNVRVDGRDPREAQARRGLGYVPERPSFDMARSARANVELHHGLAGLPPGDRRRGAAAALEAVGLQAEAGQTTRRFSKGMLQRLSFAVALLGEPRCLVLDEPFSGVDPAGVALLRGLILGARARAATIVLNSHRLDQVGRLCDQVALFDAGRIDRVVACDPASPNADETLERLMLATAGDPR